MSGFCGLPTHSPTTLVRPAAVSSTRRGDQYRIRVGDYRIIYEIQDEVLVVLVVEVGRRDDIY